MPLSDVADDYIGKDKQKLSNEDYLHIRHVIDKMNTINYVKPGEIPAIDLYMDQVTTFMDEHLESSKRYSDDKLLTKTMINNYTKNNLLPSPEKKKYTKDHMFLLLFIYYLKNILSISDTQTILDPLTENFFKGKGSISLEEIYNEIYNVEHDQAYAITRDVIRKYQKSKETFENVPEEEKDYLQTFAFISMLSFDVYLKKQMIEKTLDEIVKMNEQKKNPSEEQ